MTAGQIFACVVAWTAVIVAVTAYVTARVTQRRAAARWHIRYPVEWVDGHGYLSTQKPLTEAEREALAARWRELYGNNRAAHHVEVLRPVGRKGAKPGMPPRGPAGASSANAQTDLVCSAYQPPAAPADSGLCARCGMFDYKHREPS